MELCKTCLSVVAPLNMREILSTHETLKLSWIDCPDCGGTGGGEVLADIRHLIQSMEDMSIHVYWSSNVQKIMDKYEEKEGD